MRDIIPPKSKFKKKFLTLILPIKSDSKKSERLRGMLFVLCVAAAVLFVLNAVNLGGNGLKLKKDITAEASNGFKNIIDGGMAIKDSQFEKAKELFATAKNDFKSIENRAWFVSPKIPGMTLQDPTFTAGNALINTGTYLALAGENFTGIAQRLSVLPRLFFENNQKNFNAKVSLTKKLSDELPQISQTVTYFNQSNEEIQKISPALIPATLKDRFEFAKQALQALSETLNKLQEDIPAILSLLGNKEPHTFLILLQNNAEIRPSGGFIGNYALAETNDGYLERNEVFDIYSSDHRLAEEIPPPAEIAPANPRWFMRDSNYSAHFPLSAQKAAWFLEKEQGPGVDTVIAVDLSFVVELLRLIEPVKIPELTQPLTSKNFATIISYYVEAKISGRENPKIILKSFLETLQKEFFKRVNPTEFVPLLKAAIESKHVLAYSKDPTVQSFFERYGAAGLMKDLADKEDYLNVVHTSVSANKSDIFVAETITHDTYINSDGRITDEVKITRKHTWTAEYEKNLRATVNSFGFKQIDPAVLKILGKSANTAMLRIYVPAGAKLEEITDPSVKTELDGETGKTYFSARMDVPTKSSKTLKIRYTLPFTLNLSPVDKYVFSIQKQAGYDNAKIIKRLMPDSGVKNYKYFPDSGVFDPEGVWNLETELNKDMSFTSVWGK